jgi:hypothetical protein
MEYSFKITVKTESDPKNELSECDMFFDSLIEDTDTQELLRIYIQSEVTSNLGYDGIVAEVEVESLLSRGEVAHNFCEIINHIYDGPSPEEIVEECRKADPEINELIGE